MTDIEAGPERPLNIVHVLRAPVGGLFRHVLDLSREQIDRGHAVGLIADSLTGGPNAERILAELAPRLKLGLRRVTMHRSPHPSDVVSIARISRWCREVGADIVHGHGSKGGLFGRMAGKRSGPSAPVRVYTPHGGSLHYQPGTLSHSLYMRAERFMAARTDVLIFESGFVAERFLKNVGTPPHLFRIVRNGISDAEFEPMRPAPDAADFLYVGELRALKGIDTLLDALALVRRRLGAAPRLVLVGAGAEKDALRAKAESLGLGSQVSFAGSMPARQAFAHGKVLVVPSRAESLPYIVLEAVGAHVPMIATSVGGIPEIFGPCQARLIEPNDVEGLAARMMEMQAAPEAHLREGAEDLARFVRPRFSINGMVDDIMAAYREALTQKATDRRAMEAHRRRPAATRRSRREA